MQGGNSAKCNGDSRIASFNSRGARLSESPSCAGSATARGLAAVAACVANGGELNGVRLLKKETVALMQNNFKEDRDYALGGLRTDFAQGGVAKFE